MKTFEVPEIHVIEFTVEDIMNTSGYYPNEGEEV